MKLTPALAFYPKEKQTAAAVERSFSRLRSLQWLGLGCYSCAGQRQNSRDFEGGREFQGWNQSPTYYRSPNIILARIRCSSQGKITWFEIHSIIYLDFDWITSLRLTIPAAQRIDEERIDE